MCRLSAFGKHAPRASPEHSEKPAILLHQRQTAGPSRRPATGRLTIHSALRPESLVGLPMPSQDRIAAICPSYRARRLESR